MGLLNDAIREHLELKRQRGADPVELAQMEEEALGPVHGAGGTYEGDHADAVSQVNSPQDHLGLATEGEPESQRTTAQETAELDMQLVLGADEHPPVAEPVPEVDHRDESPSSTQIGDAADPGSLEWEVPVREEDHEPSPAEEEAVVEDVLEETPDFLQETPEHERLWFEQRPPRDFDFDE
jgi:hypothetical protein